MPTPIIHPSPAVLTPRPVSLAPTAPAAPFRRSDAPSFPAAPARRAGLPEDMRCWLQSHRTPWQTEVWSGGYGN